MDWNEDTMRRFLADLAEASAAAILPRFQDPGLGVEWKDDDSPVTAADREAEEILRDRIRRRFPDHGIIGEEFPDLNPDARFTWVLDPIDGTRSFVAGCPLFGTLICLRERETPLWSAIHLPALQRLFTGNNTSAWCNDRSLQLPREAPPLHRCTLLTTDPKEPPRHHNPAGWQALLDATGPCRTWGDCFGYTLVASGVPAIMIDPVLNLWDLAALLPVLRGAGAAVADWHGRPPESAQSLVACHPRLLPDVLALLQGDPSA